MRTVRRRRLPTHQEETPPQDRPGGTLISALKPAELREANVCCLSSAYGEVDRDPGKGPHLPHFADSRQCERPSCSQSTHWEFQSHAAVPGRAVQMPSEASL